MPILCPIPAPGRTDGALALSIVFDTEAQRRAFLADFFREASAIIDREAKTIEKATARQGALTSAFYAGDDNRTLVVPPSSGSGSCGVYPTSARQFAVALDSPAVARAFARVIGLDNGQGRLTGARIHEDRNAVYFDPAKLPLRAGGGAIITPSSDERPILEFFQLNAPRFGASKAAFDHMSPYLWDCSAAFGLEKHDNVHGVIGGINATSGLPAVQTPQHLIVRLPEGRLDVYSKVTRPYPKLEGTEKSQALQAVSEALAIMERTARQRAADRPVPYAPPSQPGLGAAVPAAPVHVGGPGPMVGHLAPGAAAGGGFGFAGGPPPHQAQQPQQPQQQQPQPQVGVPVVPHHYPRGSGVT